MKTSAPASGSAPSITLRHQVRDAVVAWWQTEASSWIYIFKMALAALLALGIGMRLELDSPRTAMTTVFVVMQPQSAMILGKSFYRITGTLIGSLVIFLLMGPFAQAPELFLLCTAIWIGVCTMGSAYNRNFRSYGFVLSGYTVALIGIPAIVDPTTTFHSVVTRVTELSLGIACAGVVSILILPQLSAPNLSRIIRGRFSAFVEMIGGVLGGTIDRRQLEDINAKFIGDIIGLEAIRSAAVFEDPEIRLRSGRLSRMNSEFMNLSTRIHALHQLINRLRSNHAEGVIAAIAPFLKEVMPLLTRTSGEPVMSPKDAAESAVKLTQFKDQLTRRIRDARENLTSLNETDLLDFDTASELLYQVALELHAYTTTYASLAQRSHVREKWDMSYTPKTSILTASIAGIRAAIVMLVLSLFWEKSGWPSGDFVTLNAAALCAITSAAPDPTGATKSMAYGIVLAAIFGYLYTFHIYPHLDGFWQLAAALLPVLLLAVYLTTRPPLFGVGMGLGIFFTFLAVPDNTTSFNAAVFMNNAVALLFSMMIVAIAFAILLPPTNIWLLRHMEKQLRKQVRHACFSKLKNLGLQFESGTRDMMYQISMLTSHHPHQRQSALKWMFATLEVGRAIIDLRQEFEDAQHDSPDLMPPEAFPALQHLCHCLTELFLNPTTHAMENALMANDTLIEIFKKTIGTAYTIRSERHRLQRSLSYLHFIRTALLDEHSPLQQTNSILPQNIPQHAT